jgi:hypothetical protein
MIALPGNHTFIVGDMSRLDAWDNRISSNDLPSRTWVLFDDRDFKRNTTAELGQGRYPKDTHRGIKENGITSVRLVRLSAKTVRRWCGAED